ncbi:MAG: PIN domain-containing protein [Casimicrobium sp.]
MSAFFDTNVIVYSLDHDEPEKQAIALQLMVERLAEGTTLFISTQVMIETISVCRRKGFSETQIAKVLETLGEFQCESTTRETVEDAWALQVANKLSWFDALIVQAALQAGCKTLYTEDLQHGQTFGSLRVVNLFLV